MSRKEGSKLADGKADGKLLGNSLSSIVVGLALICSAIGHTSINYCVRLIPVHLVSLGILVEPVVAAISTWIVFGEEVSGRTALSGLVILSGTLVGFGSLGAKQEGSSVPGS